ncbi:MAG: type II toxin-antitoxin system death-on-curing family toxin [Flavobacteriales bacterium]|nr:type II toxin-antitoxin system death-on-curing family toxin [Flavobacteriales bacterium]
MISLDLAEKFHARSIEAFGGAQGLRDQGALEAALARPYQTFGGEDLYPSPVAKAAALMESVIIRHPWLDGNKRTGLGLALLLLRKEGFRIEATQDELYELTIRVAEGRSSADEIGEWMQGRVVAV